MLSTFCKWYVTLWDNIDVDQLLERCKALAKDVKTLNKAVRLYDVFRCALNNIITISHAMKLHSYSAFKSTKHD